MNRISEEEYSSLLQFDNLFPKVIDLHLRNNIPRKGGESLAKALIKTSETAGSLKFIRLIYSELIESGLSKEEIFCVHSLNSEYGEVIIRIKTYDKLQEIVEDLKILHPARYREIMENTLLQIGSYSRDKLVSDEFLDSLDNDSKLCEIVLTEHVVKHLDEFFLRK